MTRDMHTQSVLQSWGDKTKGILLVRSLLPPAYPESTDLIEVMITDANKFDLPQACPLRNSYKRKLNFLG